MHRHLGISETPELSFYRSSKVDTCLHSRSSDLALLDSSETSRLSQRLGLPIAVCESQ